jgi:hypothetical protein
VRQFLLRQGGENLLNDDAENLGGSTTRTEVSDDAESNERCCRFQ